jgi:threonylcarbamoyladenosine tRNA methylthiotransferase MtaB
MSKNKIKIVTFGCRMNAYESEVIHERLSKAGVENIIVINSCTVTGEAERQSRQTIRKLRRENPDAKIVVTGCAAQISPEKYAAMDEVDYILGNREKMSMEKMLQTLAMSDEKSAVGDIMEDFEYTPYEIENFENRSRAFIQIQQGCDHRCTYCIIPFARGKNKSLQSSDVIKQIKKLCENGYKEIVLTGIDIASYGHDKNSENMKLGTLVKKILKEVPELPRIRLGSLDPMGFDDDLFDIIENDERFLPHVHLSIQAADDTVLKTMARRHRRKDLFALCKKLKSLRPNIAIGADFITGFPTESEEMFENTVSFVKEAKIPMLHVFPYSIRKGTYAAKMQMVDKHIRKQRAKELIKVGEENLKNYVKSFLGQNVSVLAEKEQSGHCGHYIETQFDEKVETNSIVDVKITEIKDNILLGKIIK